MSDDDAVIKVLQRTNDLLGFIAKRQLRDTLNEELADKKRKNLYELTGKGIPVREISQRVGLATGTISSTWKQWEQIGLVVKRQGQYERVFE